VRCLVTGVDAAGRSAIVDTLEPSSPEGPVDVWSLFKTQGPPSSRPPGNGETQDFGVRPGELYWMISRWAPHSEGAGIHHTDTLDLDVVLSGSIDVVLDDGPHRLETGDSVVITGVDHGWKAGPEGCTLSVVLLGTPEPAPAAAEGS
jgi:hypothetical protein